MVLCKRRQRWKIKKLSVLQASQAIETARLNLATFLDIDLRTSIIVREKLLPVRASIVVDRAIKIANERNPSYLAQKRQCRTGAAWHRRR